MGSPSRTPFYVTVNLLLGFVLESLFGFARCKSTIVVCTMRKILIYFVVFFAMNSSNGFALAQEAGARSLIAEAQPAIQEQINRVYSLFLSPAGNASKIEFEVLEELQRLKDITREKDEIVKQLAIFVAGTVSEEDMHIFAAGKMLDFLEVPPRTSIRILAPYLDSENEQLRNFVGGWFHYHDSHEHIHGKPPLGSINYHEYMEYVRSRLNRNEEIPVGFIRYIYEKYPGKALLVFAYANRHAGAAAQLLEMRKALEARQQGRELTPEEKRQMRATQEQTKLRQQHKKHELWELLLAEHTVGNAIWLKENDPFPHRFQAEFSEATIQLSKLAKKEWWARLYVVHIMRQHPELRSERVLQTLKDDRNELVREAAQAAPQ
jgi:hypothetical protein